MEGRPILGATAKVLVTFSVTTVWSTLVLRLATLARVPLSDLVVLDVTVLTNERVELSERIGPEGWKLLPMAHGLVTVVEAAVLAGDLVLTILGMISATEGIHQPLSRHRTGVKWVRFRHPTVIQRHDFGGQRRRDRSC